MSNYGKGVPMHAGPQYTGYIAKSKIKSSGDSVRSKSMRSRGSHMSHKHRQDANKKGGRFNEELEVASRKSHNSRVSKHSQAVPKYTQPQP